MTVADVVMIGVDAIRCGHQRETCTSCRRSAATNALSRESCMVPTSSAFEHASDAPAPRCGTPAAAVVRLLGLRRSLAGCETTRSRWPLSTTPDTPSSGAMPSDTARANRARPSARDATTSSLQPADLDRCTPSYASRSADARPAPVWAGRRFVQRGVVSGLANADPRSLGRFARRTHRTSARADCRYPSTRRRCCVRGWQTAHRRRSPLPRMGIARDLRSPACIGLTIPVLAHTIRLVAGQPDAQAP
jgi:hypothetical protein